MLSTLSSDSNDLVSLFTGNDHGHSSRFPARLDNSATSSSDAMSPASTELSDDSSLTTDDLVVLSDLFGFVTPGSSSSTGAQGTSRPRSRKRPRVTNTASEDATALPKSQQQRQKQEIAFLKSQVVELQATVEELHARKLEREREALERRAQLNERNSFDNDSPVNEWGIAECQAAAVQQLAEQNEMLHSQVATHLGQLKQLEQIARTRYLANAFPEQKQLSDQYYDNYSYGEALDPVEAEAEDGSIQFLYCRDGTYRHTGIENFEERKKKKKSSKRPSFGVNRWVPKLLNPVEKHRDRVHRKKKKHLLARPKGPPVLFTDSRLPYIKLLARVLAFLDPLEPARVIAYMNKSTAIGVKAFYDLYCPPPRPRRYLVNRLLENRQSVFPGKVMGLLSIADRVRASGSCGSFYEASNSMPLEFNGVRASAAFLSCYKFPRTSRIHKRFSKTPALLFNSSNAEDVVNIVQMLERGGDGEDGDADDDDTDCFAAVREISLRKVNGMSTSKGKYFDQLLQTLFMGHVSSRLHVLELIGLRLADLQFKHLTRLWRDAHFPSLRRLSMADNAFSSRFVRDLGWSFENERFLKLQAIDVSNTEMTNQDLQRFIAYVSTTPALQILTLSHNVCSFATVHMLCQQIQSRVLRALRELHCVAITADAAAIGHLLQVFQITPPCCPDLHVLDVSGNPLSNPKAATQLARVFTSNAQLSSGLRTLNISSMQLGDDGLQTVAAALSQSKVTQIQHLDISDNGIRSSIDTFVRALAAGKLPHLQSLAIADNELGPLEFEALSTTLAAKCCPRLQILDLSANFARGEGIARFCPFLLSPPAQYLWSLDLSNNEIPHRGLLRLTETLARGNCVQLHELNLSRNAELKAIAPFLKLIRGEGLPSLTVLQVGYAQSRSEGHDLVQDALGRRSVEELRRLKQLGFEGRLAASQLENDAKAERDQIRCRKQTQRLREVYDHLENEADRALRRRKQVKKSSQLLIHQEITRQKQERAHARLCRQLDLDVHAA
ncbi:Protein NLRC5 [Phytophthora ramorum]|uniref:Protein NLRC5 n=1 Tax=Phytophthora ramorum TaxID=164328 RepID=UPI0030B4362A|nr:Protein NLRC5 [Phytophthora ramorum]